MSLPARHPPQNTGDKNKKKKDEVKRIGRLIEMGMKYDPRLKRQAAKVPTERTRTPSVSGEPHQTMHVCLHCKGCLLDLGG